MSKRRKEIGDVRLGEFIDWYIRTKGKDVWLKYDWNLLAKTSVYEQYLEGERGMTSSQREMKRLRETGDKEKFEKMAREMEERRAGTHKETPRERAEREKWEKEAERLKKRYRGDE